MSLRPLIAICGTTGVGKSKLAIELALSLQLQTSHSTHGYNGARIINADAMQVYAGMDIITNKVPPEEQAGVEHLLMGFKKPGEQYVVGQWVRDAIQVVCLIFYFTPQIIVKLSLIFDFDRSRRHIDEIKFLLSLVVHLTGFNTSSFRTVSPPSIN